MMLLLTVLFLQAAPIEAKDRCVLLSAEARKSPPQIELHWPADSKAAGYAVHRKAPTAAAWGDARATLDAKATGYVDAEVELGVAYEYKVVKSAQSGDKPFKGTGYLLGGIELPLNDQRGKLLLVVDSTHAEALAEPLKRLELDLAGDGWTVLRRDVAPTAT